MSCYGKESSTNDQSHWMDRVSAQTSQLTIGNNIINIPIRFCYNKTTKLIKKTRIIQG